MKKNALYRVIAPFQLGEVGQPMQILRVGMWNFLDAGPLEVTPQDIREYRDNFKAGVYKQDIAINAEHRRELGSLGELEDVWTQNGDTELWARPKYNEAGSAQVKEGRWHYNSSELYRYWEDPETHVEHKNVLVGVAHTNYPRIKNMARIACAEPLVVDAADELPLPVEDWHDLSEDEKIALVLASKDKRTSETVRAALPESAFAFVQQRKLLIQDANHVHAALGRFMQVDGTSDADRDTAWARLHRAAGRFGISVPASWHDLGKGATNNAEPPIIPPRSSPVEPKDPTKPTAEVLLAEQALQMADLKAKFEAAETARATMATQLSETQRLLGIEQETRLLMEFAEGIDKARREFRVTPEQASAYLSKAGETNAEMRKFILSDIATRPVIMNLSEQGSGRSRPTDETDTQGQSVKTARYDRVELAERAKAISKEKKIPYGEALREANKQLREGGNA